MTGHGTLVRSVPTTMLVGVAALVVAAVGGSWLLTPSDAMAAGTPSVTVTPGPVGGAFRNGESVTVSVGPNSTFDPYSKVLIIECADPRGTVANLPTGFNEECDGDTVQGGTVLVKRDGSFTATGYTLYAVPNIALQEQANWTPVCNKSEYCVLYVGEDYNDFTKPKVFSSPFLFTSDAPTLAGGTATPTSSPGTGVSVPTPASQAASGASAAVSLPASTLAFTGTPPALLWLAGAGGILLGVGVAGRRMTRRRRP